MDRKSIKCGSRIGNGNHWKQVAITSAKPLMHFLLPPLASLTSPVVHTRYSSGTRVTLGGHCTQTDKKCTTIPFPDLDPHFWNKLISFCSIFIGGGSWSRSIYLESAGSGSGSGSEKKIWICNPTQSACMFLSLCVCSFPTHYLDKRNYHKKG